MGGEHIWTSIELLDATHTHKSGCFAGYIFFLSKMVEENHCLVSGKGWNLQELPVPGVIEKAGTLPSTVAWGGVLVTVTVEESRFWSPLSWC